MTDSPRNTNVPPTARGAFDRPTHLMQTKSLHDLLVDLRKAETWLLLAAVAAFLASAFFVVKYFVGGDLNPTHWTGEQWANAALGLGITAVITAAQAFLYGSGYKGQAATIATCIVVFFGIFSEVSQSMEREDATVRYRSEHSPVFQAALGSIQTLSSSSTGHSEAQQALLDARTQWQYWQQLQAEKQANPTAVKYTQSHLARQAARYEKLVQRLQQQDSLQTENRAALLTGAIAQAKALEYDEDKHYAMIRLLQDGLNVGSIWASFLFSLIIICTFEYAFHFVGAYVADHKKALLLLGRDTRGERIVPLDHEKSVAATQTAAIPRDYGNALREQYLDWVTPERSDNAFHSQDATRERLFKLLYADIRERITQHDLKPTVRPVTDAVTDAIRHHSQTVGLQPALIGKPERQKIAETILEQLAQEQVLVLNAEQGIGKAKYKLAARWQAASVPEGVSA